MITQNSETRGVLRAVAEAGDPGLQPPGVSLGWLIRQDVLEPEPPAPVALEERELAVLRLLADGWGTSEIAVELCYSERTVTRARWSCGG